MRVDIAIQYKRSQNTTERKSFTYAGHPSPVDEANNVLMAYNTLSKCQSCLLHSRGVA